MQKKKITSALISVYHKEGMDSVLRGLHELGVELISTGGTARFIQSLHLPVTEVQSLTHYPEIFGGRVKTLHPAVMGGILYRRSHAGDEKEKHTLNIPSIDLVVVDLYPFTRTLEERPDDETEIIEKIDIGGISLIRAAAKNFHDVVVIPSVQDFPILDKIIREDRGTTTLELRRKLAARAFAVSSDYDMAIHRWLNQDRVPLRYGENPHQKGCFLGDLSAFVTKISGKELSYNNLLDLDAALSLLEDLDKTQAACVIIKHNNPCGVALCKTAYEAWEMALSCDPVSAFGGIIAFNRPVDKKLAEKIKDIFFEVLVAPSFDKDSLSILMQKPQRILLERGSSPFSSQTVRSALNGILVQERDAVIPKAEELQVVTQKKPDPEQVRDLLFAQTVVKHAKSNAIVLARDQQLLGIGTGQTSRIDAVNQAIEKARHFGFDLKNAVMASDAFFPFPDSVEKAHQAGIVAVIQPGGSVRDKESIAFCNAHDMSMVFTGIRHFKH